MYIYIYLYIFARVGCVLNQIALIVFSHCVRVVQDRVQLPNLQVTRNDFFGGNIFADSD